MSGDGGSGGGDGCVSSDGGSSNGGDGLRTADRHRTKMMNVAVFVVLCLVYDVGRYMLLVCMVPGGTKKK